MPPLFLIFLLLMPFTITPSYACGPTSHCKVDNDRHYRIRMPQNHDGKTPIGAIFFAHSYQATAVGTIRNKNLIRVASTLGVALVAVKSAGSDWHIANSPQHRARRNSKETSYFDNVLSDIITRFPIDPSKLMMAGVSVGGMMTWTLICERGSKFAGFMPISGTFWNPPPKSCKSPPANVIHVHGTADKTVPLKGRKARSARQGNVHDVLATYGRSGKYKRQRKANPLDLKCKQSVNPEGKILEFCLHEGGHIFKAEHILYAWRRFEAAGAF